MMAFGASTPCARIGNRHIPTAFIAEIRTCKVVGSSHQGLLTCHMRNGERLDLKCAGQRGSSAAALAGRPHSTAALRMRHFIDSHKAATGAAVLLLMATYRAWSLPTAWLYLGMHGMYGLLWALKSHFFGDRQWEQPVSLWYGVGVIWGALSLYWIAPWIVVSRGVQPPPWYLGLCVALWGAGVFLHFASDMQKHVHLALCPGKLLTGGLWDCLRNPNYFGELLIYLGFQLLAMHWLPLLWMAAMVGGYWVPNMLRKDRSLARYPEFAAWKARSWLFIPWVF